MRKLLELLRLHFDLKLSQRQIADSINLGQSTVNDYLARFTRAGLRWPLPDDLSEAEIESALFPSVGKSQPADADPNPKNPDWGYIHQELQQHKHTTLQLLWEEYRTTHPEGYSYSRFCYHYEGWKRQQNLVMRQEHRPGEKLFVDWAGDKIPIYDRETGAVHLASLFVAVLGASNYTYAEACWSEQLEAWIGAHLRTFEFFQALPSLLVPDNLKAGVSRACRYDPDLNPTYQEMACHYGLGVLPARRRKPRDKAKVEVGVLIAERWILAALRHCKFFSLAALNQAIRELLEKLNHHPFKKREGDRYRLFQEVDRPAMRPLPQERFDLSVWTHATVNIDYHVEVDRSFYSVPYRLAQQKVDVRATPTTVEIFHRGLRVASHIRVHKPYTAVTQSQHRPKSHQAHLDWPPSRLVGWAKTIGPHTAEVVEKILASYPHPEMGYRSCLGIIRLGQRYPASRMEAAAQRALLADAVRYKSIASILQRGLDQQPLPTPTTPSQPPTAHDNIRGADYFE
jgi:transposase